ncbi:MAG TPA: hypothetical protein VMX55_01935 [candidate division Zixibacteria bacterium]|nr:hypothetical protein [candidate division Zixibacteria bacterium]
MLGIDSDARIVLAEGIVKYFTQMVQSRKIPLTMNRQKILTRLSEINSKLMALKWSYKPLEQILLSKELRSIEIYMKEIFDSFPEKWEEMLNSRGIDGRLTAGTLSFIKYFFYTMRERLSKGFTNDFAKTIDITCGEIQSIEKVEGNNWKCLVADGIARYNVLTNIAELKKGDVVPIGKLPPQIIHGVYSEGMFLGGSGGIRKLSKDEIGKRPDLTDNELGQARGILEKHFLSKK